MERSYKTPFYPWFPIIALLGALICMVTMIYFNTVIAAGFFGMLIVGYGAFVLVKGKREEAPLDEMIESEEELQLERTAARK